jgi:hypothetical protein
MVYSTEAGDFVPVSPDEWSPPEDIDEPVTLENFPPKDPDGDPPKDPDGDPPKEPIAGSGTGNSSNPPPVGPVARGESIM